MVKWAQIEIIEILNDEYSDKMVKLLSQNMTI